MGSGRLVAVPAGREGSGGGEAVGEGAWVAVVLGAVAAAVSSDPGATTVH
jgi:hypothetical protein